MVIKKKNKCGAVRSAVAVAVAVAVWYIKVTIVTPSVTNRYTPFTGSPYGGTLNGCIICNYSVGTQTTPPPAASSAVRRWEDG